MSEHKHTEIELFANEQIRVHVFHCDGGDVCGGDEEVMSADVIVFPLSGLFIRRCSGSVDVGDPTNALFLQKGDPYEVEHPIEGGDRCLTITLESSDGTPSLLPAGSLHLDAIRWQQLIHLWSVLNDQVVDDELDIEETIVSLAGDLSHASDVPTRGKTPTRAQERVRQQTVGRAATYLNRHYDSHVSVGDIAGAAFASPYHLCRLFKESTGVTLHQYQLHLRLRHSLDLLRHTRISLSEIAHGLGFSTHSHFGEHFRRNFGSTPGDYRNEYIS